MMFIAASSPVSVQLLTLITTLVVFGLFLLAAGKFVWPKILKGLDAREEKLRSDLDAAQEARQQAKDALAEYESELAKARREAGDMIAAARDEAKKAAEELRSRNQIELGEMKKAAAAEIESAKKAAIAEFHGEASSLAVAVASRILGREITSDDQQRLVEDSLKELVDSAAK
ncbi:MAG: F0F1 ATP synthase subunit B [Phycisphaerales bacterium]|jgi:F-type H+-transporting ATPase subunit b|nr:F0F1 ATP synthase subunit B [Phycisphaerales bacterium]